MTKRYAMVLFMITILAGAPVASAATAAPVYDVQLWVGADETSPDTVVLIAGVQLSKDATLPVKVRVPLPDGVQITWAGEIMGTDPAGDVQRETTIVAGTGGRAVELTLSRSRDAQIEGLWMPLQARAGGSLGATAKWVQTVPADRVEFSVRLPAGAGAVVIDPMPPGAPQENDIGERLFTLAAKPLKPGETHEIDFSFVPGGQVPAQAQGWDSTPVIVGALAILAAILALSVVVLVRRERISPGPEEDE